MQRRRVQPAFGGRVRHRPDPYAGQAVGHLPQRAEKRPDGRCAQGLRQRRKRQDAGHHRHGQYRHAGGPDGGAWPGHEGGGLQPPHHQRPGDGFRCAHPRHEEGDFRRGLPVPPSAGHRLHHQAAGRGKAILAEAQRLPYQHRPGRGHRRGRADQDASGGQAAGGGAGCVRGESAQGGQSAAVHGECDCDPPHGGVYHRGSGAHVLSGRPGNCGGAGAAACDLRGKQAV